MAREPVRLQCSECKRYNYITSRESKNGSKLELKKYCSFDRKHTKHTEKKKN